MSTLGYQRSYTGYLFVDNWSTSTATYTTFGGIITAASYTNLGSVSKVTLTHTAIPFNYIVLANQYADRVSGADNDASSNTIWVYPESTTTT